jgi:nitrite reductase/ring-hydroxylating ferredoxin subunit
MGRPIQLERYFFLQGYGTSGQYVDLDYNRLESQVQPLRTYKVEAKDGDVWVDLE